MKTKIARQGLSARYGLSAFAIRYSALDIRHSPFLLRARAFTLIEVLVAIGITTLVMSLGGIAFTEVIRLRGAEERYSRRLAAADHLLYWVARDVRAGRAFLAPQAGGTAADTLVVSTGTGSITYSASPGTVERMESSKNRTEKDVALSAPGVSVSFDFEGVPVAEARAVVATIEWTEPPAIGVSHPVLSLRVALRNR